VAGEPKRVFLRRVMRDQLTVGAVAPTSRVLARAIVDVVGPLSDRLVVELGAGTGAISSAVGPRRGPGTCHVAIERDPVMLAEIEAVAPWAVRLPGDAVDLAALLAAAGLIDTSATGAVVGGGVDVVLCSLPWSYFSDALRARILEQIGRVLAPGAVFATIAYRPTRLTSRSRAFRAELGSVFAEVVTTSTVWANIPPARIYVCRHPVGSSSAGFTGYPPPRSRPSG
jgi:phosphatidylethanolamine/phosphatidyl-N-methylethanolamine N-methyltransferase